MKSFIRLAGARRRTMNGNDLVRVWKVADSPHAGTLIVDGIIGIVNNDDLLCVNVHFLQRQCIANSAGECPRVVGQPLVVWRKIEIIVELVIPVGVKRELTLGG